MGDDAKRRVLVRQATNQPREQVSLADAVRCEQEEGRIAQLGDGFGQRRRDPRLGKHHLLQPQQLDVAAEQRSLEICDKPWSGALGLGSGHAAWCSEGGREGRS